MATVKITAKGAALMKNRSLAIAVAKAIVKGGEKLYTEKGIELRSDKGKTIFIKGSEGKTVKG